MAITVKHKFVSAIPDAGDPTIVQPSNWNDDHDLTGTIPVANGGTGASTLTGYVYGNGTSAMTAATTIPNTAITGLGTMSTQNANNVAITGGSISGATVSGYIPTTEKAAANGVATLDGSGTVPISQLPAAVLGALSYQGTWNASTNTPTLTSSVGTKGYYYVVNVAGSTNLNGITDWLVGDWAVFNGSVWQKVDNTETVTSVNGQTGAVVLTTTNIAEGTNLYYTDARARTAISAGTGISYDNATGVVTNAAPDQTVSLTGGTGISTSGTYPNFTITNTSPSLGGDVVGPTGATDNAVARYDTTTGKLLQNSTVLISDSGAVSGVTTLAASTSVTTPIVQASNSAGLALRNSAGTSQISMGAGGGDNVTIAVATNINGANAQIDISPTGTGHVHIKPTGTGSLEIAPTNAGTMNNMVIGGTTPLAITGTTITANTQFSGAGTGLTGTAASLSIGGNAATVTNGFYTTSSFNLGTTSIAVNRASASQSLTGISIDGNAGTVTNGVYTTGSYADPTWITSLAGSKITGTIDGGTF
jgi:hypothetical protein